MEQASFWAAVRLQPHRERLALNELARAGYETYAPRISHYRRYAKGRAKVETFPLLFPGYVFVLIVFQWWPARWAPGVINFIMDGEKPARVPDVVIDGLKSREHNGVIKLPKKPEPGVRFQMNERLRINTGPMQGLFGLYAGQTNHDRIKVLMELLGGARPVELAIGDVSQAS